MFIMILFFVNGNSLAKLIVKRLCLINQSRNHISVLSLQVMKGKRATRNSHSKDEVVD